MRRFSLSDFQSVRQSLALVVLLTATGSAADRRVDFTHEIRPFLSNSCFACHGPDAEERQGGVDGLRLDTLEGATEDLGDGGRAVIPGDYEASRLLERVTSSDPDLRMPPAEFGKPLSPEEVELLRVWIEQGADYAPHWAYIPPQSLEVPEGEPADWARNAIDHFILSRLTEEGLSPSEEADRYALIRRVTLDLTGLPPTLEEVDAFVRDDSPGAYEQLVDRLLNSDAYGEHMARMWLDLARYGDSAGYADDPPRTIWAYRDWVIRAFNRNLPFDQFTIEQIAGDLLESPTTEQLTATAFHRNTLTNSEGGTDDEEFRNVAIVDRVNTTMAVWMGTTMACAQCHTHKYDPITQEEYFRFFAFLNNTADSDKKNETPTIEVYADEQLDQQSEWKSEIARLKEVTTSLTPELAAARDEWAARFPDPIEWTIRESVTVEATNAKEITVESGFVLVGDPAETDVLTLTIPTAPNPRTITALRLETVGSGEQLRRHTRCCVAAAAGDFEPARPVRSRRPPRREEDGVAGRGAGL